MTPAQPETKLETVKLVLREITRLRKTRWVVGGAIGGFVLMIGLTIYWSITAPAEAENPSLSQIAYAVAAATVFGALAGIVLYGILALRRESEEDGSLIVATPASMFVSSVMRQTHQTVSGGPATMDFRLGVDFKNNPHARRDFLVSILVHILAIGLWTVLCVIVVTYGDNLFFRHRFRIIEGTELKVRILLGIVFGIVSGIAWSLRRDFISQVEAPSPNTLNHVVGKNQAAERQELAQNAATVKERASNREFWNDLQAATIMHGIGSSRLKGGPTVPRRAAIAAVRLVHLVAAADGELDTREAGVVVDIGVRISSGTLGPTEVLEEINRCITRTTGGFAIAEQDLLADAKQRLGPADRKLVLRAAISACRASGHLCDPEQAVIRRIGTAFQIPSDVIERAIAVGAESELPEGSAEASEVEPVAPDSPDELPVDNAGFVAVWDQPKYRSVWDDGGDNPPLKPTADSPEPVCSSGDASESGPDDPEQLKAALADAWVVLGVPGELAAIAAKQRMGMATVSVVQMLSIRALRRWPVDASRRLTQTLKEVLQNRRLHIIAARDFITAHAHKAHAERSLVTQPPQETAAR